MMNLGNKIRELRKKKGLTQEQLAGALNITPQAVSKWENSDSYPDMEMIPILAGFFEVSMDVLFDYDVNALKAKIQKIIDDARDDFFTDPRRYAETMKTALIDYPGNEALLTALLDAYEYDLRENNCTVHLDDMIEISGKIIAESADFVRVCSVKDTQAAAYLKKGEYGKAKAVLESLPDSVTTKNEAIAFRLYGKDKLNGAIWARCGNLQGLYTACMEEGNAWFRMDQYPVTFRDYTPEEYIPEALKAYRKGLTVLETFILGEYEGEDSYLWAGMQTFHWSFHQCIAACFKKLGRITECEAELAEAYRIISTSWEDFEEKRDAYMEYFNRYLRDYDLAEYVR